MKEIQWHKNRKEDQKTPRHGEKGGMSNVLCAQELKIEG